MIVFIPGIPVPKGRPRFNRHTGHTYTPEATRQWEGQAARRIREAARGLIIDNPLSIGVVAVWPRPEKRPKWITAQQWATGERVYKPTRPDLDNVLKAVLDAAQLGLGVDDGVFVHITSEKHIAGIGEIPGITITIGVI